MLLDASLVGRVIQDYRESKGLSQEVVSGLADIGRTHLSAIERGTRKPTLETKRWRSLDKIYGLLFDAGVPGSGKTFDWESLKKADCGNKKLFLAGGLTPDNVKAAIEAVRSDVVDISSGVEYDDVSVKGKDESKVKAFIQNAKF